MKVKHHQPACRRSAIAAALIAACLGTAGLAHAAEGGATVASIGNVSIKQQEIERLLQSMPDAERNAAKEDRSSIEGWLRQRLASEALLQEAQGKGWERRPEIKARIDAAVREVTDRIVATSYLNSVAQVPDAYPSDAEVREAYERAKDGFQIPATYHVAQIFLAAPGNDSAAVTKARAQAQLLAAQAKSGDFADLARKNSQDERSAARGGDVGTLPLTQLLPEVRDTVARLKPGQVSEPVQSAAGFHILKLLESHAARTASLDEVKPRLRQVLRQQRQQELIDAYMAKLAPSGSVKIDNAALDEALRKAN
ncbi:peptidylprolyl isomerase [Pigmentiphaga sp. NML080357]|uniref:peptidylprolyl isomerase n=1 Tax=Pigmentiphaga sp. NML080357 TaxID=2008675 RepID=UPI000B411102|nr:peptidylprolyl isomerase [Pigmentiphaga sp. NML080357]OVZ57913.1 peptidylprolyl isomerase [Pigmentiphaga sp. NML080357]